MDTTSAFRRSGTEQIQSRDGLELPRVCEPTLHKAAERREALDRSERRFFENAASYADAGSPSETEKVWKELNVSRFFTPSFNELFIPWMPRRPSDGSGTERFPIGPDQAEESRQMALVEAVV